MKRENRITPFIVAALGFVMALGAVGCLVTAFELEASMGGVALMALLFAAATAFGSRVKWGWWGLLGFCALALGYLWRNGTLVAQFGALLREISLRYDHAYGWGYVDMPGGDMDVALQCIAAVIAMDVSRGICRRRGGLTGAMVALLPLFACLVVTDTVPANGWLFLLLLGVVELLLTGYMRSNTPEQADFLTVLAAVPTAVMLGIFFLAMPREDYVNRAEEFQDELLDWVLNAPEQLEEVAKDLISDKDVQVEIPRELMEELVSQQAQEYDLSAQLPRTDLQMEIEVMVVEADTGGVLYLRGQDYDTYTGKTWTTDSHRQEDLIIGWGISGSDGGNVRITTLWEWEMLYVPYYPEDGLTLEGGCRDNNRGLEYSFSREMLPNRWREYVETADTGEVDGVFLELPETTWDWASETVNSILTGQTTATEKADAIARYVRNSAVYDLETPKMPSDQEDFARWFLEESDRGYCVHFATATAVLLRAAGVECRYVTGYLVLAEAGEAVTVNADRAHAWVEYYEPSLDTWIVLEATPAASDSPVEETEGTETVPDQNPDQETEPDPDATGNSETQLPDQDAETRPDTDGEGDKPQNGKTDGDGETGEEDEDREEQKDRDARPDDGAWLGWLLGLGLPALLAAAAVGQRYIRLEYSRKRTRQGSSNRRALAMWVEAGRFARALKVPLPEDLEKLAEKAKYSQHALTEEEVNLFAQYLRGARSACRTKPWYLRLLYRWVYALY